MESSYKESKNLQAENLVQAFTKVLSRIEPIQKMGKNEDLGYPYLRILDLANALRVKLLRKGILLLPDDVECWQDWFRQEGRRYQVIGIRTEFTITNGKESLSFCSYGCGMSCDGTAMSKAQTMALKAWLKRIGLIFGEYDDQEIGERYSENAPLPEAAYQIAHFNERALYSVLKKINMTQEQAAEFLSVQMGTTLTAEMLPILRGKKFDLALELLLNGTDLTKRLEESVARVRSRKKAPPVPINGQPVTSVLDRDNHDEVAGD